MITEDLVLLFVLFW